MGNPWPSVDELLEMKKMVAEKTGKKLETVKVVVSPYRICPLGAHIDHQGGTVAAMTINRGILLAFVPSDDSQVMLWSGQFTEDVRFSVNEAQHGRKDNGQHAHVNPHWGNYARGALYALQKRNFVLSKGIFGYINGVEGLDSSGLSSSAAVGIAYLLALESANNIEVLPDVNIDLDRIIENEYLGLRNGILDQSAILLSRRGYLTFMDCKTKIYSCLPFKGQECVRQEDYKILLAFSGLKHALTKNPGYNCRVSECQEAARVLLLESGRENVEPLLCNVDRAVYEAHKEKLHGKIAKRASHFFSENDRVYEGRKAWALGDLVRFGTLISDSGQSSIENYESGCEPLKQMYEIIKMAPGVYGTRFCGAGFRGCCLAFVETKLALEAAAFVKHEYQKVQPDLAAQLDPEKAVLICDGGDCARIIE